MQSPRRIGRPENDEHGRATTLLTLPLSDFSSFAPAGRAQQQQRGSHDDDDDDDGLILIRLPQSSSSSPTTTTTPADDDFGEGGLTLEDLLLRAGHHDDSVYILGDTSERDIVSNRPILLASTNDYHTGGGAGGNDNDRSIEPVSARLIVEGRGGKTLELTRVETSNTYIVVPTPSIHSDNNMNDGTPINAQMMKLMMGGNKRQRISNDCSSSSSISQGQEATDATVQPPPLVTTVPARSIGLVPGEDSPSCFFLDPSHLPPGHFAPTLRRILSRWVYDPVHPPTSEEEEEEEPTLARSSVFGYSIPEIAHVCRTSIGEVEYAIGNRMYGAEDAMVIPSLNAKAKTTTSSSSNGCSRYGLLSEEGRQTVSMSIVSALIESDLELGWFAGRKKGHPKENDTTNTNGMQLAALVEEIRAQWHHMEGEDAFRQSSFHATSTTASASTNNTNLRSSQNNNESQSSQFGTPSQFLPSSAQREGVASSGEDLAAEVIWHCLRPLCFHGGGGGGSITTTANKDSMPEYVHLIPDEVAKLAVHQVFLNGTPRSLQKNPNGNIIASSRTGAVNNNGSWPEEELLEEWSMRLPSIPSGYEPRVELLRGIAISESREGAGGGGDGTANNDVLPKKTTLWTYFPEVALPLDPALRIQAMFVVRDVWTLSEAVPYLEKFVAKAPGKQDEEDGDDDGVSGDGMGSVHSMVADLLGRHAKIFRRDLTDKQYIRNADNTTR